MRLGSTSLSVTKPGPRKKKGLSTPSLVYDLTANSSVDEGATLVCNVSANLPSGDGTLYWDIAHNTTNASDFTAVSGTVTVSSQSGSFNISAVADNTTEGAETFGINLRTGSASGLIVSQVTGVTVNDTSITPVTQYYYWRSHDYGSNQNRTAMVVHDITTGTAHNMTEYLTNQNTWVSRSVNIAQFSGHDVKFAHCNRKAVAGQTGYRNDSAVDEMYVVDGSNVTTFYPNSSGSGWNSSGSSQANTAATAARTMGSGIIYTSSTQLRWCVGIGSTPSSGTGPSGAYTGSYYYYYEASGSHSSVHWNMWTAIKTASTYTLS
jgi:hypothetical protein